MPKNNPPHIIYHKQPSIQKKDPFQTEAEEKKAGAIIEKFVIKYRDEVIKRLEEEIDAK